MGQPISAAQASTPEEVAAVTAVIALLSAVPVVDVAEEPRTPAWVRATRLNAARAGLQRGPWRLSGRMGRRSRA